MTPKAKQWWRKPACLILLFLLPVLTISLVAAKFASTRGLNRQIDAIRSEGLPVTPQELDSWYQHVPASENLAARILEAHAHYVLPPEDRDPTMMYSWRDHKKGEKLPPLVAGAAADYVGRNAETIALLHGASNLKQSRYPVDLSQGITASNSKLAALKSMASLLRWDAILKAENGDAEGARASIRAGFALVASLRDEPIFISSLVRISCAHIHLLTIEEAVNRVAFDDAAMAEFAALAEQAEKDGRQALFRAMVSQRVVGMDYFSRVTFKDYEQILQFAPPGYDKLPDNARKLLFNLRRATGVHDSEHAFFVENMDKAVHAANLDFPEMLPVTSNLLATVEAQISSHPIRFAISYLTYGGLAALPQKEALLASKFRCLRAALAVQRYRLSNAGKIPTADEVVPNYTLKWPLDAVDNTPLDIEKLGGSGFRVIARASTELANEGRSPTSTNRYDTAFKFEK